jgi:microcystin-dependent protein
MSDPFVAEIRIFPFNFAPTGWAFCDGQILPLSQNTALFSLLGTMYGGDGKSTFGLPDMQGNSPMQQGQGSGLSARFEGETGGEDNVTLLQTEIPVHTHQMTATDQPGQLNQPNNTAILARSLGGFAYSTTYTGGQVIAMNPNALAPYGSSQPHNNLQPYLTLNFCIALQGIYPPRS